MVIHTDCKSVSEQANFLLANNVVPQCWTHVSWWNFLHNILTIRKSFVPEPFSIRWCKAHQCDHIPIEWLTPSYAKTCGIDFHDLYCNRVADQVAQQVLTTSSYSPCFSDLDRPKILPWQRWLSLLHVEIGADYKRDRISSNEIAVRQQPSRGRFPLPHEISTVHDLECFANLLPKWSWFRNPLDFTWIPSFLDVPHPNTHATISVENWDAIIQWSSQQKWKLSDELQTSWVELACCAYFQGLDLVGVDKTPACYASMLQKVFNQCSKLRDPPIIFPGIAVKSCKANGMTHPIGHLKGAEILIPIKALKFLAMKMLQGCSHSKKHWMFEFPVG